MVKIASSNPIKIAYLKSVYYVPTSTVPENPRFISGYICKSSIFSFIEKTLG